MIDVNNNLCVGCGACVKACPVKCISLNISHRGEYRPVINYSQCKQCGACNKVCLLENCNIEKYKVQNTYFGWEKDIADRKNSSSGGLAFSFSKYIIESGGAVVGATFDSEWNVEHIIVDKIEDLRKIQGSKYVESRIDGVLNDVKKLLIDGIKVLFFGVPCQIYALKSFLKHKYDNLICVEVFCHGAPRIGVFKKYISYMSGKYGQLKSFNFRSKKNGWATASYEMKFEKKNIIQKHSDNIFHLMFGYHNSIRTNCFKCICRGYERVADISLGDFWGIEKFYPDIDTKDGVSVILVNTNLGSNLISDISNKVQLYTCSLDEILDRNFWFVRNYDIPDNQGQFEKDYLAKTEKGFFKKYIFLYRVIYRMRRRMTRIRK